MTVAAGEIVGLIGPNGAGKSTVFNLITGALEVMAGRSRSWTGHYPLRSAAHCQSGHCAHLSAREAAVEHVADRQCAAWQYLRTRAGFFGGALRLDRAEEGACAFEALRQLKRVGLGANPYDLAGNLPLGRQRFLKLRARSRPIPP